MNQDPASPRRRALLTFASLVGFFLLACSILFSMACGMRPFRR